MQSGKMLPTLHHFHMVDTVMERVNPVHTANQSNTDPLLSVKGGLLVHTKHTGLQLVARRNF